MSRPGVLTARSNLKSSSVFCVRQNSGIRYRAPGAPTLTGQPTLPTSTPDLAATSQMVGTAMSSAYQYQPSMFLPSGSNVRLE